LVRYSYPDGEPLDYLTLSVVPISEPAWAPGTAAEVIFPASDGRLHRVNFDRPESDGLPLTAVPLIEGPDLPWSGRAIYQSVCWPDDPRLRNVLIVSLITQDESNQPDGLPAIWWLRLDDDRRTIVEAGRVTQPTPTETGASLAEQCPQVITNSRGRLQLAYLTRDSRARDWRLVVAPMGTRPRTGAPVAWSRWTQELTEGCHILRPVFANDGQWVACMVRDEQNPQVLQPSRHPTPTNPPWLFDPDRPNRFGPADPSEVELAAKAGPRTDPPDDRDPSARPFSFGRRPRPMVHPGRSWSRRRPGPGMSGRAFDVRDLQK